MLPHGHRKIAKHLAIQIKTAQERVPKKCEKSFTNIDIDSCSPGPLTVQSVTFTKCEGDLLTAQDTWCLWEVFICMSSKSESIISRLGLSD